MATGVPYGCKTAPTTSEIATMIVPNSDIRLPVTLLSGFLGAGKTTLLQRLLTQSHGLRLAIIVNDMSELNIDAALIRSDLPSVHRTTETLVEMSNGCICCTLREDLLLEVGKLARSGRFDHLVIESTGISEPMPVAETFTFEDESGQTLGQIAYLDTLVTVVDAKNFLRDFGSEDTVVDRQAAVNDEDQRSIVDLMTEQIEFANVLLLNKIDLVSHEERKTLRAILHSLNPNARILEASFGSIDHSEVIGTGLYREDLASTQPGWLESPRHTDASEADEYGVRSFVYRAQRPFHPDRLTTALDGEASLFDGVLRSKGFCWIASRHDEAFEWGQAGVSLRLLPAGLWWASAPQEYWPEDQATCEKIRAMFLGNYGDRRQELVFIGIDMQESIIRAVLDHCLLTDQEFQEGPDVWSTWEDSFGVHEDESIETLQEKEAAGD
jgi:G3E family GTPase